MKIKVLFTGGTIGSLVGEDGKIRPGQNPYKLIAKYQQKYANGTAGRPDGMGEGPAEEETDFDCEEPYRILSENLDAAHLNLLFQKVAQVLAGAGGGGEQDGLEDTFSDGAEGQDDLEDPFSGGAAGQDGLEDTFSDGAAGQDDLMNPFSGCRDNSASYDGIIITHGTDTLQYTASFLNYVFPDVEIPIVLVSSAYVLDDERENGTDNFYGAVELIRYAAQRSGRKAGKDEGIKGAINDVMKADGPDSESVVLQKGQEDGAGFAPYGGVFVSYKNEGGPISIFHGAALLAHEIYEADVHCVRGGLVGLVGEDGFTPVGQGIVEGDCSGERQVGIAGGEVFSSAVDAAEGRLAGMTEDGMVETGDGAAEGIHVPLEKTPFHALAAKAAAGKDLLKEKSPVLWLKNTVGMTYPEPASPHGIKVILLESYHSGTIRISDELAEFVRSSEKAGVKVFLAGLAEGGAEYETVEQYRRIGIRILPPRSIIACYCRLWLAADNGFDL